MFDVKIETFFRWYDLWIGLFYDRKAKRLYCCPVPTLGFWIEIRKSTPPNQTR
jgi:hypothetical protein